MINLGPNLEQYFLPVQPIATFFTAAYVAGRLPKVGWDSAYGKSLLSNYFPSCMRA